MTARPLRLTLVRHAVTDANIAGYWLGHTDAELGEVGVEQAHRLRARLAGVDFDAAFSSDLKRCTQTAAIARPDLDLTLDARLRELNFGDFEGRTYEENVRHPEYERFITDPVGNHAPNGESYTMLLERVRSWIAELPDDGDVIAFTHGGVIQSLTVHALEASAFSGPRFWRVRVSHASVTVLERWPMPDGQRAWTLVHLNDDAHLR